MNSGLPLLSVYHNEGPSTWTDMACRFLAEPFSPNNRVRPTESEALRPGGLSALRFSAEGNSLSFLVNTATGLAALASSRSMRGEIVLFSC